MRTPGAIQWCAFGAFIKSLRLARGWSLRGFAREIPIAASYESFIESGAVAPPSDSILARMAEILEVPPQTLMTQAGRLPPEILLAFWQHPAIPPVLSTIPGMTLEDAQMFCRQVLASLSQSTPA
jgi:putative DNA methylase